MRKKIFLLALVMLITFSTYGAVANTGSGKTTVGIGAGVKVQADVAEIIEGIKGIKGKTIAGLGTEGTAKVPEEEMKKVKTEVTDTALLSPTGEYLAISSRSGVDVVRWKNILIFIGQKSLLFKLVNLPNVIPFVTYIPVVPVTRIEWIGKNVLVVDHDLFLFERGMIVYHQSL